MRFWLAKFFQVIGLTEVGLSLFVGLTEEGAMLRELFLLMLGVVIFCLGRLLEPK